MNNHLDNQVVWLKTLISSAEKTVQLPFSALTVFLVVTHIIGGMPISPIEFLSRDSAPRMDAGLILEFDTGTRFCFASVQDW